MPLPAVAPPRQLAKRLVTQAVVAGDVEEDDDAKDVDDSGHKRIAHKRGIEPDLLECDG